MTAVNSVITESALMNTEERIYYCNNCMYNTTRLYDYNRHLMSNKHVTVINEKKHFVCNKCKFATNNRFDYTIHLDTHKHNILCGNSKKYECKTCNKSYTVYKSYWKHKNFCESENGIKPDLQQFSLDVIAQQDIFKELIADQHRQLVEKMSETFSDVIQERVNERMDILSDKFDKLSNQKNIIYTTNNTNNHFNLNLFLNVYCKDAMNLSDFMRSIDVQLHELEYMGEHGYVAGITRIITSRLSAMDICKRPIHCSDLRREILHIRENNEWIKDIGGEKTQAFIYNVNIINYKSVGKWMIAHPKCEVLDTPEYNQWFSIAKQSVNPGEGKEKRNLSIFKNIIRFCHIDKQSFLALDIW